MIMAKRVWAAAVAVAALGVAAPAEAVSYGGWNARASMDTWYDDNLARGLVLPADVLPNGNQDLGMNVGLTVGNAFVLTPDVDTWVIASAHGRAGVLYPSLSGAWGSLFSNTVWHLDGGRETYALLGSTHFFGAGTYHAGELGFVQPLWTGASARVQAGAGRYFTSTTGSGFTMPTLGGGLDHAFTTGTLVGVRYAYQTLMYEDSRVDPRHQVYGYVSQRLGANWEVHARYLRTVDLSTTAGYTEGYMDAGIGYDF
jgi:hypothetical protein